MSDFLSRLAEQALGAAPAVQPLIGSRHAPAARSAEPEGFVEETVEREVPRIPAHSPAPPRLSAAPPTTPDDPHPAPAAGDPPLPPLPPRVESASLDRPPAAPIVRREAEAPLVPTSASPSPPAPPAAPASIDAPAPSDAPASIDGERQPSSARGEIPRPDTPLAPRTDTPLLPRTEASPVAPGERRSMEDPARPRRTFVPDARLRADADGAAEGDALLMPRNDLAPATSPADPVGREDEAAGTAGRAARTLLPSASAQTGARELPPAAGREEAERPVVQVTIGRIEVRAVHPPAAPQPAREPGWTPPVLSLDEYLKRGSAR